MIADDEETFRESTSRPLGREGFDCQCVKDAEETINSLLQGPLRGLIADIRMPHNPDLRVVNDARGLDSHLPIILVTGYPSAETAIRGIGLAVGADLTKPVDFDELLLRLCMAVEKSHRRRTTSVVERLCSVVADLDIREFHGCFHLAARVDESCLATIRTLALCPSDLPPMAQTGGGPRRGPISGELLDCPQCPAHRQEILKRHRGSGKDEGHQVQAVSRVRMKFQQTIGLK